MIRARRPHIQPSIDARQKEYGSDGKLNQVRNLIDLIHENIRVPPTPLTACATIQDPRITTLSIALLCEKLARIEFSVAATPS